MARAYDSTVLPQPAGAVWEIIRDLESLRSTLDGRVPGETATVNGS
jgi:hypothetical protein